MVGQKKNGWNNFYEKVMYEDESSEFIEDISLVTWQLYGNTVKSKIFTPFKNEYTSKFEKYLNVSQDLKKFLNAHSKSVIKSEQTNEEIFSNDLLSLKNNEWLNDSVIYLFIKAIVSKRKNNISVYNPLLRDLTSPES